MAKNMIASKSTMKLSSIQWVRPRRVVFLNVIAIAVLAFTGATHADIGWCYWDELNIGSADGYLTYDSAASAYIWRDSFSLDISKTYWFEIQSAPSSGNTKWYLNETASGTVWDTDNHGYLLGDPSFGIVCDSSGFYAFSAAIYNGSKTQIALFYIKIGNPISSTQLNFSSTSQGAGFPIYGGNMSWTASVSDDSWLTLNKTSGFGNENVGISVTQNPSVNPRSGTMTVFAGGLSASRTIYQSGAPPALTISPTSKVVGTDSGQFTITVTANCSWVSSINNASWITSISPSSGTGNGIVTVSYSANTSSDARSTLIGVADTGATTSKICELTQSGNLSITVGSSSVTIPAEGGSVGDVVYANIPWIATDNATWLTVSPTSGSSGNSTVTFTATPNSTASSRTANVNLSNSGYGVICPVTVNQPALQTYAVTYYANEATSGTPPVSQNKILGVPLTLSTNTGNLTKTGYIFAGWNTAANGSGTDYAAGGSYTANATITLYAKWVWRGWGECRFTACDRSEPILYRVDTNALPPGISPNRAIKAVATAFNAWASVTSLRFEFDGCEAFGIASPNLNKQDRRIWVQLYNYGGYIPSSTTLGVGGYAWWVAAGVGAQVNGMEYSPTSWSSVILNHTASFYNNSPVNMEERLAHEIGHALALNDSIVPDSIMRSTAYGGDRGARLGGDDVQRIQAMYPINAPPYGADRILRVMTRPGAQINPGPGTNGLLLAAYALQPTNLTIEFIDKVENGGTFNLNGKLLGFTPSGYFTAEVDPASRSYYSIYRYRLSDGVNKSPVISVRITSFLQDGDSDFMPDNWESLYTGLHASGAAGDKDGDGLTNYQEWMLGTDPLSSTGWLSGLKIREFKDGTITWTANPYELYEVQATTNLSVGFTVGRVVVPTTTTGTVEHVEKNTAIRFYKVRRVP